MKDTTKRLLMMQGYTLADVQSVGHLGITARWTPFACALCGAIGLLLRSPAYFAVLALLTSIGAFTDRSGYDRIYNGTLKFVFRTGDMIRHGKPRRLGCGIGAVMYGLCAAGFLLGNKWLGYTPALVMVVLASFAAATNICFASILYRFMFGEDECCSGTPSRCVGAGSGAATP